MMLRAMMMGGMAIEMMGGMAIDGMEMRGCRDA
jgi:hypothetical protein